MLTRLTDPMLEKAQPLIQVKQSEDREVIFREGQEANYFYTLPKGKVLLEVEVSEAITFSLGSTKAGCSFGWSALLPGKSAYTAYAIRVEPSDVMYTESLSKWRIMGVVKPTYFSKQGPSVSSFIFRPHRHLLAPAANGECRPIPGSEG